MTQPLLTAEQHELLLAAQSGDLSYRSSRFLIAGVELPELANHAARDLTFEGLLVEHGDLMKPSSVAELFLAGAR